MRVHLRLAPIVVLPLVDEGPPWAALVGAAGRPASLCLNRDTRSASPSVLPPVPSALAKATNVPIVNKLVAPACFPVGGLGTPRADATAAKPPDSAGRFTEPHTHLQSTTAGKYSPSCSAKPLAVSGSGLQVRSCGSASASGASRGRQGGGEKPWSAQMARRPQRSGRTASGQ